MTRLEYQSDTKLISGSDLKAAFLNADDRQKGRGAGLQATWLCSSEIKASGDSVNNIMSAILFSPNKFLVDLLEIFFIYLFTKQFFHGSSKFTESAATKTSSNLKFDKFELVGWFFFLRAKRDGRVLPLSEHPTSVV